MSTVRRTLDELREQEMSKEGPGPSMIAAPGEDQEAENEPGKPDWWKYELFSPRVYVDVNGEDSIPLLPNYPGTDICAIDEEPQRYVPLYLDFATGRIFFYDQEAKDLGAL